MKKIKLLVFAIGIFTTLGFALFQGGDDPVEGIDIIIKNANNNVNLSTIKMDKQSLKELSALADKDRSVYLSKYITPIVERATTEKGLESTILKGLLENRCVECKSFETFTFKVLSNTKKENYTITFNIKFDTKWITVITDRERFDKPIPNPHNFELIDIVNQSEKKLNTADLKKFVKQFEYDFYRIEGHIGKEYKTKEDVFKGYIKHLKTYKSPGVYVEEITKFPPVKKKVSNPKAKINKVKNVPIPPPAVLEERIKKPKSPKKAKQVNGSSLLDFDAEIDARSQTKQKKQPGLEHKAGVTKGGDLKLNTSKVENRRISERLRHKNRAISIWDYKNGRNGKPLANPNKNPLIDQINEMESTYSKLKVKEVQNSFAKQNLSNLETKDDVLKAYIQHMKVLRYRSRGQEVN
ncbi:hypothetical protein [Tenacibaculum aquimarinum]|uniref:hypothetical protein n=1 Tax=Tenacibaculum aquimarinum TaxID=2910675 RepID=UPI001F0A6C7C|nr:hypothetical protein [Tenacibaculum aquimarinum]MCH3885094.1 hypothetical protein [Tenacibaculum aquimarinum]